LPEMAILATNGATPFASPPPGIVVMKSIQATDARNRFGELLEDAISKPVIIQKNGRDVAVLMSKAEFDLHFRTRSKKNPSNNTTRKVLRTSGHSTKYWPSNRLARRSNTSAWKA
jgi:prevent-host-death family protein